MTSKIDAPKAEACNDCRYYLADDIEDMEEDHDEEESPFEEYTGVCRRYPPSIFLMYPEPICQHPYVIGTTGWCGEFTPKL